MARQSQILRKLLKKKLFEDLINSFNLSDQKLKDLDDLNLLAEEEKNQDIQKEIITNIKELRSLVKKNEIKFFYQMKLIH